jgi:hypothetical protein
MICELLEYSVANRSFEEEEETSQTVSNTEEEGSPSIPSFGSDDLDEQLIMLD